MYGLFLRLFIFIYLFRECVLLLAVSAEARTLSTQAFVNPVHFYMFIIIYHIFADYFLDVSPVRVGFGVSYGV